MSRRAVVLVLVVLASAALAPRRVVAQTGTSAVASVDSARTASADSAGAVAADGAGTAALAGDAGPGWWGLMRSSARFSGSMTLTAELYGVSGIDPRRPGAQWRLSAGPQLTVFGDVSMGIDALLSTQGVEVRQNVSQLGLTPSWSWGTGYLGDYSSAISPYTLQGIRLRGAGADLRPGAFRVTAHVGRTERMEAAGGSGPVFQRNLIAARVGVGDEASSFLDLTVLKAKDNVGALETTLVMTDPTLADTLFNPFVPRLENKPQENLVMSAAGQLSLLQRSLVVKGEVAGALITRDLESPRADPGSTPVGFLDGLQTLRLSTSGDLAYNVDVSLRRSVFGLQGAYEYVGAGYTSLGLPYLIGDRASYRLGGDVRLFASRVMLQGQVQHQNDNLGGQQLATTNRDVLSGSVVLRPLSSVTASFMGVFNDISNDAAVDTFAIDTRSMALNATTTVQHDLFGIPAGLSLGYGYQQTGDSNPVRQVPDITVQTVTAGVQLSVTSTIGVAPSVSAVFKDMQGEGPSQDVFLGFRGTGRFLDNRLRTMASVSRTFSHGREVLAVMGNVAVPLPLGTSVSLSGRINDYSAYGAHPGFNERQLTVSMSRSF